MRAALACPCTVGRANVDRSNVGPYMETSVEISVGCATADCGDSENADTVVNQSFRVEKWTQSVSFAG